MIRVTFVTWAAALLASFGLAGPVNADFVTYTFSGTGTGDLGGAAFTNADFRVTITGNTGDISLLGPGILDIVNLPAVIEVAGLGSLSFANPVYVFNNQTAQVVGFGDYSFGDFQGDFWDQPSHLLVTYNLATTFGPITTSAPIFFGIFTDTDRGFLELTQSAGTAATFKAQVAAVPEPSSALLFGLGLACLAREWKRDGGD